MKLFNTTNQWLAWWKKRKIDWAANYQNWQHPHRFMITSLLSQMSWMSLIEIGCGAGANLMNIVKHLPNKQVGGVDVNPEAIATAQKTFQNGWFKVNPGNDIMISDKSADVILSDMVMIYVSPFQISSYVKEIKRVARNYVVLCEFHHKSWWQRFRLKWRTGYNAYNWPKLLEKYGFYDISVHKIPYEGWPDPEGDPELMYRHIIVACVPKK